MVHDVRQDHVRIQGQNRWGWGAETTLMRLVPEVVRSDMYPPPPAQ